MEDDYIPWWIPADDPRRTGVFPPSLTDAVPIVRQRGKRVSGAAAETETAPEPEAETP